MEYTRLTKEQTYYLEKCYAYIARDHSLLRIHLPSIKLNGVEYNPDNLKKRITNILVEKYYHESEKPILNNLKEYYIQNKFNEKSQQQREKPKV